MNTKIKNSPAIHIAEFLESISKTNKVYLIDNSNNYYQSMDNSGSVKESYPFYINRYNTFLNKFLSILFSTLKLGPESERGLLYNSLDISKIFKTLFVCKKNNVDIVICANPNNIPLVKLACKILSIKIVFEEFNVEFIRLRRAHGQSRFSELLKRLELWCCNNSDLIFTVSDVDRKTLIDYGVNPKKIVTVPNSSNFRKFKDISETKISYLKKKYKIGSKRVVMMHGDWSYRPNRISLGLFKEKIYPIIYERYGDEVLFLIFGNKTPAFSLKNVITLGWVDDLANHLALSEIALVPLLSGGGTRNKILDYLAMGIPVVSTYVGSEGIKLKNRRDALLSRTVNSDFIKNICYLLDNPLEARSIGRSAQQVCKKFYSWSKTSDKAIKFCNELIKK